MKKRMIDGNNVKRTFKMRRKYIIHFVLICVLGVFLTACSFAESINIEGKWKVVSDSGFGQAQPGTIIAFDGTNCNLYSPSDTYKGKCVG